MRLADVFKRRGRTAARSQSSALHRPLHINNEVSFYFGVQPVIHLVGTEELLLPDALIDRGTVTVRAPDSAPRADE